MVKSTLKSTTRPRNGIAKVLNKLPNDRWEAGGLLLDAWQEQMNSDGDIAKDFIHLAQEYADATPTVRAIVDRVFVALGGYSLATVIRVAAGKSLKKATDKAPYFVCSLDYFPGSGIIADQEGAIAEAVADWNKLRDCIAIRPKHPRYVRGPEAAR
jgi:hypothetical protein